MKRRRGKLEAEMAMTGRPAGRLVCLDGATARSSGLPLVNTISDRTCSTGHRRTTSVRHSDYFGWVRITSAIPGLDFYAYDAILGFIDAEVNRVV